MAVKERETFLFPQKKKIFDWRRRRRRKCSTVHGSKTRIYQILLPLAVICLRSRWHTNTTKDFIFIFDFLWSYNEDASVACGSTCMLFSGQRWVELFMFFFPPYVCLWMRFIKKTLIRNPCLVILIRFVINKWVKSQRRINKA